MKMPVKMTQQLCAKESGLVGVSQSESDRRKLTSNSRVAESGVYVSTTSRIRRMEVDAITVAVMWLTGTSVTKTIKVSDSEFVLHTVQNRYICHE